MKEPNKPHSNTDPSFVDRCYGCILGAFLGDALGAPLEFSMVEITSNSVEEAMKLQGGGKLKTGKGQITDDSELAICLGRGLLECNGVFSAQQIVKYYGKWMQSPPFDVGNAIGNAFSRIDPENPNPEALYDRVKQINETSQSNGTLMRMTPLAVWLHDLDDSEIDPIVRSENLLTHCNKVPLDCCVCYCICIKYLLRGEDPKSALTKMQRYAKSHKFDSLVLEWIEDGMKKGKLKELCKPNVGWIKYGFINAINLLYNEIEYIDAMKTILLKAGDTDTNAAIVGGLIGARLGLERLPKEKLEVMLKYDGKSGRPRPEWLVVSNFKPEIEKLISSGPKSKIPLDQQDSQNQGNPPIVKDSSCACIII